MTTMVIDNKATAKKPYEYYRIDRRVYRTVKALKEVAEDCMNDEVYLIRVYEDDKLLFEVRR